MAITYIVPAVIAVVVGIIGDFFLVPAWAITNTFIYWYLIILFGIFFLGHFLMCKFVADEPMTQIGKMVGLCGMGGFFALLILGSIFSSTVFRAKSYANVLGNRIVEQNLAALNISLDDASFMDAPTAEYLAITQIGETAPEISSSYKFQGSTLISYNGVPHRLIALDSKGFGGGNVSAYITVNLQTEEVTVHNLEQPIKYTPNAILFKDLNRHIHYRHPTRMLAADPHLEIDDAGNPYYVAPVVKKAVFPFGGKDIGGVVLVDACTGSTEYYPIGEVPSWVDQAYPSDLIVEQFNNYGKFRNGFLNSMFGKNGLVNATDGFGVVGDGSGNTFVYTGVKSRDSADLCNGFLYCNLRTKETSYYAIPGADETTIMEAANTAVAEYEYKATYPLMLVVEGTPTYIMSMHTGTSNAVSMYAMANVNKYQLLTTARSQEEVRANYKNLVLSNDVTIAPTQPLDPDQTVSPPPSAAGAITGTILDIRSGDKDGTTYFYLRLDSSENWYSLSLTDNEEVIKLNTTDTVVLDVSSSNGASSIIPATLKSYTEGEPWW